MIYYKQGDLLRAPVDIILHGANCQKIMGAGIAAQIKKQFPKAYEVDLNDTRDTYEKLGSFSYAFENNKHIYNLYTQPFPGKWFSLSALDNALVNFKHDIAFKNIEHLKIGMPYIGCGIGGGNWNTIFPLINKHLSDLEVYIYSYEPVLR